MRLLWSIFKNDCKLFLKDKVAVVLLSILPVLCIGFFVTALSSFLDKTNFIDPFSIAVVDEESSSQTRVLIRQLEELGIFQMVYRIGQKDADQRLLKDEIAAVIVIPKDFSESILQGRRKSLLVIGNPTMPLQTIVVRNVVQSAANVYSSAQSAIFALFHFEKRFDIDIQMDRHVLEVAMKALGRKDMLAESEEHQRNLVTPAEYFSASLLVIFFMYAGLPVIKLMVWERENGIMQRLRSTCTMAWQSIASKFLLTGTVVGIQFVALLITTKLVFRNYWSADMGYLILLMLAIIFAVATWTIMISCIAKTASAVDLIGNLWILFTSIVGGSIYPLTSMPQVVEKVSRLTINRWGMEGFLSLFSGYEEIRLLEPTCILFVIGLVQACISVWIYKNQWRRV